MRRVRALMAVAAAAVLAAVPAVASARLPRVLTQLKPAFQLRPAVIGYTGDGTGLIGGLDGTSVRHPGHLRWTTYTHRQGIADGLVWLNDCTPDCADGTFSPYRVRVHVFSPHHGRFRRLTLMYRYQGRRIVDRRYIHHYVDPSLGENYWNYAIVGA